jgi:ABC-type antimicrobial peptide transport system permease subunit
MGLRIALGARRGDVIGMVLLEGAKMAAIGLVTGVCGSVVLTRVLASLLVSVKPAGPLVIVAAALPLVSVALLACYIPVRRAMRLNPVVTLRHE